MPIVFVHGVNNREGPEYAAGVETQKQFFRMYLGGVKVRGKTLPLVPDVIFPYWGGLATTFAWDMASLPSDQTQALGTAADANTEMVAAHLLDALGEKSKEPEPLTALAKKSFPLAVDALTRMALASAEDGKAEEYAAFVVKVSTYAADNPDPPWVAGVGSDDEFINELIAHADAPPANAGHVQPLGAITSWVGDQLKAGGQKVRDAVTGLSNKALDRAGDFASTKVLAWTRDSLNATLGRFFGDVFIYVKTRGDKANPGPIPQKILGAIDAAVAAAPNEPLVVVGHSLGGVISMDLFSHFRPNLDVDLFVSVGSQVAHFEEIKMYLASDPNASAATGFAKTPPNVHRWINIFDPVDIFSYSVEKVFKPVNVDASYDTRTYVIKSHTAYFEQADFYKRLRARIEALP
ncbi:MAG TPA: hypothetical protein VM597_36095 [Gemmataceae bacterium]|nr:hypothetical protein [Gemmataceae bacterium]